MEESFWHSKWELGHTAFHEQQANPLLVNHLDKLQLKSGARIFVPLSGKTLDIGYLLDLDYQVVGVEFSELAIKELFQQLEVTPIVTRVGKFTLYQAPSLDIFVGDFFDLDTEILGQVDAIYDRAALIALPEEMRQRYSKHLMALTDTVKQLLVCLDYDQSIMAGPPFSIDAEMVKRYYAEFYNLQCIESNEIIGGLKRKAEANESAWLLI